MKTSNSQVRIGFAGSGFIAKGIAFECQRQGYAAGPVLTRRKAGEFPEWATEHSFTNEIDELIEHSDLVVECSGDVIHATDVVDRLLKAGIPVVTMNAEFHVTTGSHFVGKGILTEAEGDQPGCLAALHREATAMGFEPLVYGNVKGYLNHDPIEKDMLYWSEKNGISLEQTVSFTDGTKMQIEQAFVANALGLDILEQGLAGATADDPTTGMLEQIDNAAAKLAAKAESHGTAISDFAQVGGCPAVFITGRHDDFHQPYLDYMKMGAGPYYSIIKNYHLCHLEAMKTINDVVRSESYEILMDNSKTPTISIAALAKRDLKKGMRFGKAVGSFDFRGEAIRTIDHADHVPIGLLQDFVLTADIERGQMIDKSMVSVPQSLAASIHGL